MGWLDRLISRLKPGSAGDDEAPRSRSKNRAADEHSGESAEFLLDETEPDDDPDS